MKKWLISTLLFTLLLGVGASQAALESVYVDLFFNIAAVDELTVTLLGESTVTSSPGGTACPQNIEFNCSTGTCTWLNATVTGGGSVQDDTDPILSLDNTGTTTLNISMEINETLGSCLGLKYNLSWCATPITCGIDLTTANVTINASFEPADSAIQIWLWGNFSTCYSADDEMRRLKIWAETV